MSLYFKRVRELVSSRYYLLCVSLVFIACFGFIATHISIGVDDLFAEYYNNGGLFAQGRFTASVVYRIIGLKEPLPIIPEMMYGTLMLLASICYLYLIESNLNIKLDTTKCVLFTSLFISYPLVAEIYVYNMMPVALGLGYFCTAISLLSAHNWIKYKQSKQAVFSMLFMIIAISAYESFVILYICYVVGMMLLKAVALKAKFDKKTLLESAKYASMLLIAIVLEYIFTIILINILGIKVTTYAATNISWSTRSLADALFWFVKSLGWQAINAFGYLPIRIYIFCTIIGAVIALIWVIRKKRIAIMLLYFAFVASTWLLALIQGEFIYRTCQAFAFFVAFVFLVLLISIDHLHLQRAWTHLAIALTVLIIIWQSIDLNTWFLLENRRYEEEKNVLLTASDRLHEEQDLSKPVIFVGKYELSYGIQKHLRFNPTNSKMIDGIISGIGIPNENADKSVSVEDIGYQYVQTTITSSIRWSVTSFHKEFGVNGALYKFYDYLGIDDFIQGTPEMYEEAKILAIDMEAWPSRGAIVDKGDYIIVNFGVK